jgi:hypothetical protein
MSWSTWLVVIIPRAQLRIRRTLTWVHYVVLTLMFSSWDLPLPPKLVA